jgi:DNA invertase Pin-like site-specific DNA recombinase
MSAQVSQLTRNVLHAPGWILTDIYIDFQTGASGDRRELNRLLNDCRDGVIDTVFTKSISRMGRNTLELLNIIRELRSIGVRIIFEQEELDSSKYEDELLITLIEAYAQEESYNRSQNIRWGLEKRKKDGTSGLYKRKCYGYAKSQDGTLIECPEEAEVVRLIFQLYLDGCSIMSIIKTLHSKQIPTSTGKEKWCTQAIVKILTNEKYTGNVILGKTISETFPGRKRRKNNGEVEMYLIEQVHPAIISKETFEAVQTEMQCRSNIVVDDNGIRKRASSRYVSKIFSSTYDMDSDE